MHHLCRSMTQISQNQTSPYKQHNPLKFQTQKHSNKESIILHLNNIHHYKPIPGFIETGIRSPFLSYQTLNQKPKTENWKLKERDWRKSYTLERIVAERSSGPVRTPGLETETVAEILNVLRWRENDGVETAKPTFMGFAQRLGNLGFGDSGPPLNVEGDKANEEARAAAMELMQIGEDRSTSEFAICTFAGISDNWWD